MEAPTQIHSREAFSIFKKSIYPSTLMLTHKKLVYQIEEALKKAAFWKLDGKNKTQKLSLPALWNVPHTIFSFLLFWGGLESFPQYHTPYRG